MLRVSQLEVESELEPRQSGCSAWPFNHYTVLLLCVYIAFAGLFSFFWFLIRRIYSCINCTIWKASEYQIDKAQSLSTITNGEKQGSEDQEQQATMVERQVSLQMYKLSSEDVRNQ